MSQEITTTSWGKRILNALWGIIFGIICIFGSIYLVFWNEGNGLHTAQSLDEAQKILVSIPASPIDPANNLRIVYLSGEATTKDVLHDTMLNVSENAIQLNRKVEMYQWQQNKETRTEKQVGGSEQEVTTYSYKQVWSENHIDSSEFRDQAGHVNPASMPIKSKMEFAANVTIGDFHLPKNLIEKISGNKIIDLGKADLGELKSKLNKAAQLHDEGIYIGENPGMPKIGDTRIRVTIVPPEIVSIIAQQTGSSLQPYIAHAGKPVYLLEVGQVSADEMIYNAKMANNIMTWVLRLVSLLGMMIGFSLIMAPISVLADVIPFFGNLVEFGTGVVAFIAGLALWTITLATAWFTVRPLWAVGLVVMMSLICYLLYSRKKNANLAGKS